MEKKRHPRRHNEYRRESGLLLLHQFHKRIADFIAAAFDNEIAGVRFIQFFNLGRHVLPHPLRQVAEDRLLDGRGRADQGGLPPPITPNALSTSA